MEIIKKISISVMTVIIGIMVLGCNADGNPNTANGRLVVYNETGQTIEIQYTQETDSGFEDKSKQIAANSQAVLYVYALWYDADVVVIYDETSRQYDLDFRITETAELYVHAEDFQ